MSNIIRPMLAGNAMSKNGPAQLRFPVYASYKYDGVRAIIHEAIVKGRSMKPIPNQFIQKVLGDLCYEGLDGELICGEPNDKNCMQNTTSGVMSIKGEPEFRYYVFDQYGTRDRPYKERLKLIKSWLSDYVSNTKVNILDDGCPVHIALVNQHLIENERQLMQFESQALSYGYEGIMVRSLDGKYKFGRSTLREGYLLKLKRFSDGEAMIVGVQQLMHNDNEAIIDELGYTSRSTAKDNLVAMQALGALLVKDCETGIEFKIGTGFTMQQREDLWAMAENLIGKIVKYKHFEIGVKSAPRFPIFTGFRNPIDM